MPTHPIPTLTPIYTSYIPPCSIKDTLLLSLALDVMSNMKVIPRILGWCFCICCQIGECVSHFACLLFAAFFPKCCVCVVKIVKRFFICLYFVHLHLSLQLQCIKLSAVLFYKQDQPVYPSKNNIMAIIVVLLLWWYPHFPGVSLNL